MRGAAVGALVYAETREQGGGDGSAGQVFVHGELPHGGESGYGGNRSGGELQGVSLYDEGAGVADREGTSSRMNSDVPDVAKGEIKKLEIELWNLKVKGNDVPAYTERFQELTLICTKFVANETEKVDKYISGLPDNIYGNVKSARPKTLDETIELAKNETGLDQKTHHLRGKAI
ncbi:hypothetical protein Tco_0568901 [Tanacetum coccineum]